MNKQTNKTIVMNRKGCFALCLAMICCMPAAVQAQQGSNVYPSFLQVSDLPDGVRYLPAPPDTASVEFLNDFTQYQWGKSIRNTPRGQMAVSDAAQAPQDLAQQFAQAFGLLIDKERTPQLYRLIALLDTDCGNATQTAKVHYRRKRPYVQFHESTAVPDKEARYRTTGSYPSGHAATGWGVALVLAEIHPARQEEILKRGYEIGESRIIAGYHYRSDVDAARLAGSAAVARLHADKGFAAQLQKAKAEFARLSK